jgi:uncharacterized protein (TIGR02145 family)
LTVTSPPTITTTASPTLINCGESATLTASSTSAAQPCITADLPTTLQTGLVGYWPFCGNASDASGNGNNGTVNGANLTTDRFGNANSAYGFDGVNDIIDLPLNSPQIANSQRFTIQYWMNTLSQNSQTVFANWHTAPNVSDGSPVGFYTGFFGNSSGINIFGAYVTNYNVGSNSIISTSTWNHIVLIYDGTEPQINNRQKVFVNGVFQSNNFNCQNCLNNIPSAIGNIYNHTTIGGRYNVTLNNIIEPFNGKIDELAFWSRVLTSAEIQQLYSLGNVNYTWSTGATTSSITVSPAQTTSYSCTASNSAGSTTSSVTVNVADSLSWTGLVDTDWHKPCNWSPQFVPKCCNNVLIPVTSNQPIVSGVAAAEDLTIYTTNGALLTVNTGANLQIADCPTTITTTSCPSLAVLTTTVVSSITQTSAISGGTITYQGASAITARGVCWSTSINPTIANSFTTNGTGVGTYTSNLTGLVTGTTYYVRAYATNASGTSYGNEVSFVTQTLAAQYPAGSVFCASGPTAIVDVTNPTTGKTWMDRNLGASQVATSSTDAAAYGDLYQWGRGNDGHQCRTSATTTTLSATDQPGNANFILAPNAPYDWRSPQNANLWQGVNGVNNPCPGGYRLPTEIELDAERTSWISNNSAGAYASLLKLTASGSRIYNTGSFANVGTFGYYWSSAFSGTLLMFLSFNAYAEINNLAYGRAVRCIKN